VTQYGDILRSPQASAWRFRLQQQETEEMIFTVEYRDFIAEERVLVETDEFDHAAGVLSMIFEDRDRYLLTATEVAQ
jgi:hypothetical protein